MTIVLDWTMSRISPSINKSYFVFPNPSACFHDCLQMAWQWSFCAISVLKTNKLWSLFNTIRKVQLKFWSKMYPNTYKLHWKRFYVPETPIGPRSWSNAFPYPLTRFPCFFRDCSNHQTMATQPRAIFLLFFFSIHVQYTQEGYWLG